MPRTAISRLLILAALSLGAGAHAADLTVSAASSLTNAFQELKPAFESAHPGTTLLYNFAASGALLQQIAKGAPVDVFASADQDTMDAAQTQGLLAAGARRDFASNALVVIVPSAGNKAPSSLGDLAQPGYQRIAIGLPASVPVGRYTKSVLEQARLWSAIEPKMIGAQNVRQALDYTTRGEVDAAFVYATDAALVPGKVKVALEVPTPARILYPIAPLAKAGNADGAAKFVQFIQTPLAQGVLAKYGFGKP